MEKKKHHYVPKAYLQFFCDESGKAWVYRKDDLSRLLHQAPSNTAFERYYYSQPTPDGARDNNRLEDLFSQHESSWPGVVNSLLRGEVANDRLEDIFTFMALQRTRVPASRDAHEAALAASVRLAMHHLHANGKLPPMPPGLSLDSIGVAIDPHQSLHGMVLALDALKEVFERIGLHVIRNDSGTPFVTSDNPVIWFDPSILDNSMRPYVIRRDGPIRFMFPVASNLMIFGSDSDKVRFSTEGLKLVTTVDSEFVDEANHIICRFAYHAVFARSASHKELVARHADLSPVLAHEVFRTPTGSALRVEYMFGPRSKKPKWSPPTGNE